MRAREKRKKETELKREFLARSTGQWRDARIFLPFSFDDRVNDASLETYTVHTHSHAHISFIYEQVQPQSVGRS